MTEPEPGDRKKVSFHYLFFERVAVVAGLWLVKVVFRLFFRLHVRGTELIPAQGPFILAPNHASYLDAFSVLSTLPFRSFKELYTLGIQKYFAGKFGEAFARLAHVIPIDQETYLTKALQLSSYVLRNGKSLLVFPEGGRSYDGEMMDFKKGVGILSTELHIPLVPVYIKGSFEALPRTKAWPKFVQIRIIFGKHFYPSDLDMSKKPPDIDVYQFMANELRDRVRKLKGEERQTDNRSLKCI